MEINSQNESQIVCLAKDGDANAMELVFQRYKEIVKKIARSYKIEGADEDDLIQEGMIGVFRAVKSYNGDSPFEPYVRTCIKNAIYSVGRQLHNKKNSPLQGYLSLSSNDENDIEKSELVSDESFQPEKEFLHNEEEAELQEKLEQVLSPLEVKVLYFRQQDYSYDDIAKTLNKDQKSIDNALQRIRKKINSLLG